MVLSKSKLTLTLNVIHKVKFDLNSPHVRSCLMLDFDLCWILPPCLIQKLSDARELRMKNCFMMLCFIYVINIKTSTAYRS